MRCFASLHIALALVAIASQFCGRAFAQALSLTPSCGTTNSPLYLNTGGWPAPSKCDSCIAGFSVTIDNTSVYGAGNTPGQCLQGFTIDLHNLPSGQCATCSLLPGDHVLKVTGFTECAPDYFNQTCVQTPFTIVSASGNADPWAFDLQSLSNGMRVTFSPAGVCDIPPCDSILLIQSARIRGVRASDTLNLTYADVKWRPLRQRATRDSQLTTVRYRIDVDPAAIVPYNSIAPYTDAHPGSKGVVSQTATFTDRPLLLDRNFPGPDVLRIVWSSKSTLSVPWVKGKVSGWERHFGSWRGTMAEVQSPFVATPFAPKTAT